MSDPFRIPPAGSPADYVTYRIAARPDVGVVAACKDVGCPQWAHGWETIIDESTDLGRAQATYIRQGSGRTFVERRTFAEGSGFATEKPDAYWLNRGTALPGLTVFRFEAFQRCFAEHRTKPDAYWRRDGDWRSNPTGAVARFTRPQDWIEDFQEHEGVLADERQKG